MANKYASLDTSHVKSWIKNSKNRERATKQALKAIGLKLENEIKSEAISIQASSKLHRSIGHRIEKKNEVYVHGAGYAEIALETGRKPGKQPPIDPIKGWARKRGLPEGVAFMIAKKIGEEGTKKHRTKRPKQITKALKRVQKFMDKELLELLDEYAE